MDINLDELFVWNSFNAESFSDMPHPTEDMIVVVANAANPHVAIYDCKGLNDEQRFEVARQHGIRITQGCNYHYNVVRRIGNTYLLN